MATSIPAAPGQLTFNSLVTTTGTISSPAWDGHASQRIYRTTVTYNAGYSTNCQPLTLPIGTTNVHAIIDMPPAGEDPNSALGQQRYYNKADLVLLVSNSTVTLTLQTSPADPQPTNITAYYYPTNSSPTNYVQVTTNFPFLTVTNTFTDQRESDTVKVTDIDMGILNKWLLTNTTATAKFPSTAGVYTLSNVPNILYAADNRSYTNGQLTAVRLKNGADDPHQHGHHRGRTTSPAGSPWRRPIRFTFGATTIVRTPLTWTPPTRPRTYPASLVSDALTILSGSLAGLAEQSPTLGSSGGGMRTATTHRERRHSNGHRPFHRLRRQPNSAAGSITCRVCSRIGAAADR